LGAECRWFESSRPDHSSHFNGIRELFEHQGHRDGRFFETQAAQDLERTVRMELPLTTNLKVRRYNPSQ
jgi:hypothetical protein